MLVNLLPGIRDLRTPLATGYIWLLTFWLWIPNRLKVRPPSTGVLGDFARLTHYSGRIGIGIALSFIAYLIGVLSELFNAPLTRAGSFLSWYGTRSARRPILLWEDFLWRDDYRDAVIHIHYFWKTRPNVGASDVAGLMKIALVNARYRRAGIYDLEDTARREAPKVTFRPEHVAQLPPQALRQVLPSESASRHRAPTWHDLTPDAQKSMLRAYLSYLIEEVYKLGNSLLGAETELFSAYDRLIAEYEFRVGVTAPLIALFLTLVFRWTPMWLFALLPILILLKTGSERRMEAGDILTNATKRERLPVAVAPERLINDFSLEPAVRQGSSTNRNEPARLTERRVASR